MFVFGFAFEVDVVGAAEDVVGEFEVFGGGSVVDGEGTAAAYGVDAVVSERDFGAVDALVVVFADEDVVGVFPDEGADEEPVGGVEVLGFVDKDVVHEAYAGVMEDEVEGFGGDGEDFGEAEALADAVVATVGFEHCPEGEALVAAEFGSTSGRGTRAY